MRKKLFSARYPITGFHHCDDTITPERLVSEILDSEEDRDTLAARLIEAAKALSMSEQLDMDIYDSPVCVQIDLILDCTLYFQSQMQAISALMQICDMLSVSILPERQVRLSLSFYREAEH